MHIPDGFLSNRIAFFFDLVSGAGVLYGTRRVEGEAAARLVPIMGVFAAFVFAAQVLNFPVLGGTSGHLVGGALMGILLGPMAGWLTMAAVIIAQALFLQDGGLIALGANLFNIGAVTVFSGYAAFQMLGGARSQGKRPVFASFASFAAGWVSIVLSATCCALELALSGAIPLRVGLPAMAGYHAVIGIGEGGLTAGVLAFLAKARPDLLQVRRGLRLGVGDWIGAIAFVAVPLAILLMAGSSTLPDPLQKLLEVPSALSKQVAGTPDLLSPDRYRAYFWQLLLLLALIGAAFLANRIIGRRRSRT